jgi:hypothetical protein
LWDEWLADKQSAATLVAAGASADDMNLKSFSEAQAEFDERLAAEPVPESPTARVFRDLGLVA